MDLSNLDMGGKIPRPYQIETVHRCRELIAQGKRSLIICKPTGCHDPSQLVLTPGYVPKPISSVSEGDELLGPDGVSRRVLAVHYGQDEMYRITPTKGSAFICNGAHRISLKRTSVTPNDSRGGDIVDVAIDDYITWSLTQKHIHKLWRPESHGGLDSHLPLAPYFLGMLLGDGLLSQKFSVGISKPDMEVETLCHEQAALLGMRVRSERSRACPTHFFVSNGTNRLLEILGSLGLRHITSGERFVPSVYLCGSFTQRSELLAGLIDSDGSLSKSCYDWISKSQRLAIDVATLARSVGLAAYVASCEKYSQDGTGGVYYRVSISGDTSRIPCRIPRKKAEPRKQRKSALKTGFTIEPLGRGEFCGVTVDGDHRYLLDDFTVTHNSGKTTTSCMLIKLATQKGNRTLFLAQRRELIHQTSDHLADCDVVHGIILAQHDDRYLPQAPVQVASKQTLEARALNTMRMKMPACDLLVIDECHGAMSAGNLALIKKLRENNPKLVLIGLTATPARGDGKGLGSLFDEIVQPVTYDELRNDGFLVPSRVFAMHVPNMKKVKSEEWDQEAARRVDRPNLVGDIYQNWKAHAGDRTTVCFAKTIDHSLHIYETFLKRGVKAAHIDQSTPIKEREDILGEFASGAIQVMCNVAVLTEGYDNPRISAVILACPSRSVVKYRQMGGRALRPFPDKDDCCLLDHAGAVFTHGMFPDDDMEWTLSKSESIDKSIQSKRKSGESKEPNLCESCHAVFHGPRCPNCGSRRMRSGRDVAVKHGLLTEQKRKSSQLSGDATFDERQQLWHRCLAVMANRGQSCGAAARMYKSKCGQMPWETVGLTNIPGKSDWKAKVSELFPQYVRASR